MAMLDISRIFEDGIHVFRNFSSSLTVPPLPATIFMMQRDVVNHYRYALTHYLTTPLDAYYLQNSSIGSPYEKWAKFTNEDFEMLAFAVHNLIRYTGRLGHETERENFRPRVRMSDVHRSRIHYIGVTVALGSGDAAIGLRVEPDDVLTKTAFATAGHFEGTVGARQDGTGGWINFRTTVDADGNEHTKLISTEESQELLQVLRPERIDISDRAVLDVLREEGLREVAALEGLNREFGALCRAYYGSDKVAVSYDCMNESWWI